MLRWTLLLGSCLLAACATVKPPPDAGLFHDEAFAPQAAPIDPEALFALSPSMRELLAEAGRMRLGDARFELVNVLYGERKQVLEYDSTLTRNAAEAFEARRGNCLSLVIMTAAFAKAAGLGVQYREVQVDESWTRSGDLQFASGHVNLALFGPTSQRSDLEYSGTLIVDFLPAAQVRTLRTRTIGEKTIVAMFMNNRAAEALARGDVDDAYWWAREAVRQDRGFLNGYNTLAVIYTRHGRPQWAQPVLQALLELDPGNTKVMGNLVAALKAAGREDEARAWERKLAARDPHPPFYFLDAGQVAMQAQDWTAARDLFLKELDRQPHNPELHFWLAQASYRLGDLRGAGKHLEQARRASTTPQETALYAAKLGWLREHGLQQ